MWSNKFGQYPDATLLVGGWSSRCNNCGKECNPSSETHDILLGYGDDNGKPGCGIKWTHIAPSMFGNGIETAVKDMRPDLEFIEGVSLGNTPS